ncbi:polymorphic toxin-type HINT domain-containing protein [Tumebacillus sp. DT12]|uniref:Polymorphic toxin-type HINT domain-containing protein n=1 Tax=Tumebacillus lacus TaxID=2995335 RepID=A0ABT3X3D8_9BACL|nr:polymorphic toxin-type HINT domain-containing protein [Tumebacillus lacus]MCX7570971.1 polymorphic toxin-type HINT domain-containing protein [Tumebacillus lacus]
MFGFHGRKDQGYLGNLRDRGHQLFYHYDAMGNVNDLTDHLGSEVLKYRYDAFGGVFTQLWTPYNNVGLTGKSYDIKASLMDYSARWYSPAEARFTTKDTWAGLQDLPQTLNRYAYALNNPVNITDPSGHAPCYEDDDGVLHCGYDPDPDNWEPRGGGGGGGGGGYTPPNPDPVDPDPTPLPPAWMDVAKRAADLLAAAGFTPDEIQKIIPQLFSTGVDFIPVVGNIKSGLEATLGIDLITGEKLSTFDRVTAGVSAFSLNSGALRTGLKTAGKVADVALDTSRYTDDLTDVSRALSCGRCFGAGTKVATDEGPKNIEDIQVGDKVLSKNDVTGDLDYKEVEELFTRIAPDVYRITIGNETLTTTAEHPFYIHNVGWVRTQDLHIGDKMETSSGTTAAVEKIEQVDEPTKVYNFSVADYHTYFVSELEVWTHNSSKDCGAGAKVLWGSWADYPKMKVDGQDYAQIGVRLYSRHAVDRLQPSGKRYSGESQIVQAGGYGKTNDYGRSVSPNYVEDVIQNSTPIVQENGNLSYVSGSLQVITNKYGTVVTVITK